MGFFDSLKSLFSSDRVNISDRFELLREAISGTMSKFYLARDKKSGKTIGLKILDTEKTEAVDGRFKSLNKPSEGEIALKFKHPLVVETYEYGTTSKGEAFIVMEYLDGPGMNSLIIGRDARLRGKRLNLIRQAAEGLQYIHQQGYIHRDICPRNYVVAKDLNTVKLIDFGLTLPAKPEFMQPGNRVGTPNYMSPEIVRRKKTDLRVDVFSFGVSMYELCAFELPFPKGNATGQAALNHDKLEPVPLEKYCPKLQPKLIAAIMQCLQPEASNRPANLGEFLKQIADLKTEEVA